MNAPNTPQKTIAATTAARIARILMSSSRRGAVDAGTHSRAGARRQAQLDDVAFGVRARRATEKRATWNPATAR
jgi:hypothetical protein